MCTIDVGLLLSNPNVSNPEVDERSYERYLRACDDGVTYEDEGEKGKPRAFMSALF